jgi:hypothetical protein
MVLLSIERNTGIAICSDELKLFDEISSYYQYAYSQIYEIIKCNNLKHEFVEQYTDITPTKKKNETNFL